MLNVDDILETSSFADGESGGGAKWVQWRKSNASKQLIGLFRAAIEAAAAMPAVGSSSVSANSRSTTAAGGSIGSASCSRGATTGTAAGSDVGIVEGIITDVAATHTAIHLLHILYMRTQYAALWPALREWLSEEPHQRGLQDLWRALAWLLEATKHERDVYSTMTIAIISVDSVLQVSLGPTGLLPRRLQQHPSLVAALRLVLGRVLPGLIASSPYMCPDSDDILETSLSVLDGLTTLFAKQQQGGAQLWDQLHPAAMSLWTVAAAAVRRGAPHSDLGKFLQVGCYPSYSYLYLHI